MASEEILLDIKAKVSDLGKAKSELEELIRLKKELESTTQELGGASNVSQKDFDNFVSQNIEMQTAISNAKRALRADRRLVTSRMQEGTGKQNVVQAYEQYGKILENERENVRENYTKFLKQDRDDRGDFSYRTIRNVNRHTNSPSEGQWRLDRSRLDYSNLRSELIKSERTIDTSLNNGYITHQQRGFLDSATRNLLRDYQGMSEEDAERILKEGPENIRSATWSVDETSLRGQATARMEQANANTHQLENMINQAELDFNAGDITQEEFDTLMKSYTDELNIQQRIHEKNLDIVNLLDEAYERLGKKANDFNDQVAEGEGPRQLADRNSALGRFQSRASVIATAIIGAVGYAISQNISQGLSIVESQREPSMSIGTRTGDYDFRGIRRENMRLGTDLGLKGTDMLGYADSVISNLGYTDDETLNDLTRNRAVAQRTLGVSSEALTNFTESTFSTGAVSTADQAKAIQDGFIGGIRASGMQGREEEQIKALTTIHDQLAQGRNLTNEDLESQLAMANLLSSTGLRSLQGDNLAQFTTSLDDTIRDTDLFSDEAYLLGIAGNPEYTGAQGMWEARKRINEGATFENIQAMLDNTSRLYGGDRYNTLNMLHDQFGLAPDNAEAILDLYNRGEFTEEAFQERMEQARQEGAETLDEREQGFMESSDQTVLETQANQELAKSLAVDNAVADAIWELRNAISEFTSQNAATGALGVVGQGLFSGLVASVGTLAMAPLGQMLSDLFTVPTKILSTMAGGTDGGFFSGILSKFGIGKGATAGASASAGASGASSTVAEGTRMARHARGVGERVSVLGRLDSISKSGLASTDSFFGGSTATKIGLGLDAGMGVINTLTAEKGTKLETGMSEVGRVGGGWLGAKGGALGGAKLGGMLGTTFGPVGAAIGAIAGGGLGYVAGSGIGQWGMDKLGNLFGIGGSNKVKASEEDAYIPDHSTTTDAEMKEGVSTSVQDEQALQYSKHQTELLRQDNLEFESENLSIWDSLVERLFSLLEVARAQNGIIGLMTGLDGLFDGAGGGSGVGGELGYTSQGQYWTNNNLTRHDLGKTVDTLTSDQLNRWINSKAKPGSAMYNQGEAFMRAGRESGLDPRYLVAHAAHETGWGTSNIVKKKGNFYGIGAFDASPMASAYSYNNNEAGIVEGARWIAENYYQKRGATDLKSMNVDYATDPGWARKIANTMRGSEKYTQPSTGETNITTNVTLNSTGSNERDAQAIATNVNRNINTINNRYTREYRTY